MQILLESLEELQLLKIFVSDTLSSKEKVEEINKIVNNDISEIKKILLKFTDCYKHIYHNEDKIFYIEENRIYEVDNKTLEIKK